MLTLKLSNFPADDANYYVIGWISEPRGENTQPFGNWHSTSQTTITAEKPGPWRGKLYVNLYKIPVVGGQAQYQNRIQTGSVEFLIKTGPKGTLELDVGARKIKTNWLNLLLTGATIAGVVWGVTKIYARVRR